MSGNRRRRAAIGILLAAALAGGAFFSWRGPREQDQPGRGAARYRNVVLVCIDTLRADSLTAYGGDGKMPGLDAFAATSTVFLDSSSHAAWTLPSISTLLTGLEPTHHGIVGQGETRLLPQVVTLAMRLHDAGYSTAAATGGAWMSQEHGLTAGFDSFSMEFDRMKPEAVVAEWQRIRPKDRPFFLFLHTLSAHDPYGKKWPPRPLTPAEREALQTEAQRLVAFADAHGGRLSDEALETLGTMFLTQSATRDVFGRFLDPAHMQLFWNNFLGWIDGGYARTPTRTRVEATLGGAYRDGLVFPDSLVTGALRALDALPLPKDTLVILVADHGEAFGEHDELVHGRFLYDELVRVPLMIRAPDALPRGPVRGSCGLADVFPTVLNLLGLSATAPIDGRSLLSLASGKESGHPIIAEESRPVRSGDALDDLSITSVRTERAKYLLTRDGRGAVVKEELYDLAADPREKSSLPLDRIESLGAAFCATVKSVRAAPRSATKPGTVIDPSGCR